MTHFFGFKIESPNPASSLARPAITGTKAKVSVISLSLLCFSAAASCRRLSSSAAAELPDPEEFADVVIEFDANEAQISL